MSLEREEPCRECRPQNACKNCGGKGTITVRTTFNVKIDKGALDGHRIVYLGEGNSKPGFDLGDLVVELVEIEDSEYKRFGSCLCREVNLTLDEALCGFEKTIHTTDSRELAIAPERGRATQDGTIWYVENEGIPLHVSSS